MASRNPATQFKVCDINQGLIDRWNRDDLPFYEPQLDAYFHRVKHEIGNIEFTTDVARCITGADVILIAVNTPASKSVELPLQEVKQAAFAAAATQMNTQLGVPYDMRAFFSVVDQIGDLFDPSLPHKIIIEKSTVPLGTALKMR